MWGCERNPMHVAVLFMSVYQLIGPVCALKYQTFSTGFTELEVTFQSWWLSDKNNARQTGYLSRLKDSSAVIPWLYLSVEEVGNFW